MKSKIWFYLIALLSAVGCHNPDENKPVIESVYVNGVESIYLTANAGSVNTFEVKLTDDHALRQMKIAAITQAGVHQHVMDPSEAAHPFMEYNQGVWDTLSVQNLTGTESTQNFEFSIPDTVSGIWILEIAALDEEGNIETKNYSLHVVNNAIPQLSIGSTIPAPASDGIFYLSVGDSLILAGNVIDADNLSEVKVDVVKSSTVTFTQTWTNIQNWFFDLAQVPVPVFQAVGTYKIHVYATDITGRETHFVGTVLVE